jgi:hypothetical protein
MLAFSQCEGCGNVRQMASASSTFQVEGLPHWSRQCGRRLVEDVRRARGVGSGTRVVGYNGRVAASVHFVRGTPEG